MVPYTLKKIQKILDNGDDPNQTYFNPEFEDMSNIEVIDFEEVKAAHDAYTFEHQGRMYVHSGVTAYLNVFEWDELDQIEAMCDDVECKENQWLEKTSDSTSKSKEFVACYLLAFFFFFVFFFVFLLLICIRLCLSLILVATCFNSLEKKKKQNKTKQNNKKNKHKTVKKKQDLEQSIFLRHGICGERGKGQKKARILRMGFERM